MNVPFFPVLNKTNYIYSYIPDLDICFRFMSRAEKTMLNLKASSKHQIRFTGISPKYTYKLFEPPSDIFARYMSAYAERFRTFEMPYIPLFLYFEARACNESKEKCLRDMFEHILPSILYCLRYTL